MSFWKPLGMVFLVGCLLVFCGNAKAETMTFQGPTQTDDNCLIRNVANANFGTSDLDVGRQSSSTSTLRRALLRFDLSPLAGKTVTAASLTLTRNKAADAAMNGLDVNLYRILPANASWVEGTGLNPETGASCWNYRSYNDTSWIGLGGLDTAGTDYDATPVGKITLAAADTVGTQYVVSFADVSFLQGWVDNSTTNAGFRIASPTLEALSSKYVRFFPSEYTANTAYQPLLTVTYVVPEPPAFILLASSLLGLLAYVWRKRR